MITDTATTEWSGYCDPCDPANYWIDDETGERVNATTGERSEHRCDTCPSCGYGLDDNGNCPSVDCNE